MTETLRRKLSDSPAARWTAMLIVSFTMMCGYFITDVMAPLEDMLTTPIAEGGLGWTSSEYGFFSGAYGYINVFLLMLFFGGLILDKCGIRFTGILSCSLMVAGTMLKWWALSTDFGSEILFGYHAQVVWAAAGFAIFGVGAEITGITVSKVIIKWFEGHEVALAMGLQVAMARIGTAAALAGSLSLAKSLGGVAMPVLVGGACLCIGLLAYLVYCVMDRRLDASCAANTANTSSEEGFRIADLPIIFTNRGFWLITLLCLMFYAGVFPFLKFATKLMITKYGVSPDVAGFIPAMLPFGTILLTPIFGTLYDRIGRGATLMVIGSIMLTIVHVLFALPLLNIWWFAVLIMVVLGIAFSLVPSALWPSVPKIIPMQLLGSAYATIFYIQNIGLSMVPLLIGYVIDHLASSTDANGATMVNYTIPMTIFAAFGLIAILISLCLLREDRRKGYGLEQPNIK